MEVLGVGMTSVVVLLTVGLTVSADTSTGLTALDEQLLGLAKQKHAKPTDAAAGRALIDQGANASAIGEYRYTPLMWAIVRHKSNLARLLLEANADMETANAWGAQRMHRPILSV